MCPVTALYKRDDGIVDFDNERCIGCKSCTQACPYDALYIDPISNTAAKCNYCSHRVDEGLLPACVVACPEKAIIAGDLLNMNSEISQLLFSQKTSVRKPEKGTGPNVFYIDAKATSLEPTSSSKQSYVWSSQDSGVGLNKNKTIEKFENHIGKTKRTYDVPDKGIMWGNEVVGYLITKAIAAGLIIILSTLTLFGIKFSLQEILTVSILSFVFIALTGALLIKDLSQPKRFLYIVFRPQFKSWLTRGTYIILSFGAILLVLITCCLMGNENAANIILEISLPIAILTAIYTAFLFAQAKGRAFWNNKVSILFMLLHAIILGSILLSFILTRNLQDEFHITEYLHFSSLLTTLILFKGNKIMESNLVSDVILKGQYKYHFWLLAIVVGNIIPVLLLIICPVSFIIPIAYLLLTIGIITSNYLFIRVPQLIPLS